MVSEIISCVPIFHLGGSEFFIKWVEDPVTTMTMNPRVFSNHGRYIATQYFPDGIGTLMKLKDTEHADIHDVSAVWFTLGSFGVAETSETPSMGLSLKTWVWSLIWEELLAYISLPDTVIFMRFVYGEGAKTCAFYRAASTLLAHIYTRQFGRASGVNV